MIGSAFLLATGSLERSFEYECFTDHRPEKILRHRAEHHPASFLFSLLHLDFPGQDPLVVLIVAGQQGGRTLNIRFHHILSELQDVLFPCEDAHAVP